MKNLRHIFLLAGFLTIGNLSAQITCDSITSVVKTYLETNKDQELNRVYISDGQIYRAFLDESQVAEFEVTFYGNSTYRIATSAGVADNYVIFEIYDKSDDRNLLFSSADYSNAPYWNFQVENTIDCIIEVKLDLNKKLSGCVRMMIGFEKSFNP